MKKIKVKVEMLGINTFVTGLGALSKAIETAVKNEVQKAGSDLQISEQRLAPVDTGNLKRSTSLEITDNGMTAIVEPTADYASYQEYGTRYQPGKAFVRPSVQAIRPKFERNIKKLTGR